MILDLGQGQKSAYIYLEKDDETFSKVTLNYSVDGGVKSVFGRCGISF
jgi:hypothetical protein